MGEEPLSAMAVRSLFSLDGRVVLVTGGGRGIGRQLALAFAEAGADVAVAARTEAQLGRVAAEIRRRGRRAVVQALDQTKVATIDGAIGRILDAFGRIDILVNNAGVAFKKPALEVTEAEWDLAYDTNVKGAFFVSQRVAPAMIAQGGGKIINLASALGAFGQEHFVPYGSAKAAVIHMTRVLAVEWAKHQITVNALAPTTTRTPDTARPIDPAWESYMASIIPLGRIAETQDLIGTALFLASPASDFVTGQVIFVDGGLTVA